MESVKTGTMFATHTGSANDTLVSVLEGAMVGLRENALACRRAFLLLAAAAVLTVGCARSSTEPVAESAKAKPTGPATGGKQLYAQHCAACHGENGNGQGLAAQFLFPKPRDFRAGRFRLVSTSNGVPSVDDLIAVLRRGMPGSAMPPWSHLGDQQIRQLAEHVLTLRHDGAKEILLAQLEEAGDESTPAEVEAIVARLTTPGDIVPVPDLTQATPESLARGKELYVSKACAQCHGATGKGDGQEKMVDAKGLPTRPRDFTRGIFKGNTDPASIWRRIWTGMPGTPMPSSQSLAPGEVTAMTHFILSLSDEAARDSTVLTRQRITARKVAEVPTSDDPSVWQQVPSVRLRMVPLWWRDNADPDLTVQAVHDGKSLCLRLSWADANANTEAGRSEDFEDAVAVELYRGTSEPFFGMGAAGAPIDMWFWDADRQFAADLEDTNPNVVMDVDPFNKGPVSSAEYHRDGTKTAAQPRLSLAAAAVDNPIVPGPDVPAASSLETAGPGTVTFRPRTSQLVSAHGQWSDGRWTVLMSRPLRVESASEGVSLAPGDKASLAFAVWDGALKDRDGKKLVTIWQDLELER
jgi:mono/diheme cytochrome c family protein